MTRAPGCAAVVVLGWVCGASAEVVMETVRVGHPGNVGELAGEGAGGAGPDRICGAVGYSFNIGKFEVTAGQYAEFLGAVAATDTYGLYDTQMSDDSFGCKIERTGSSPDYTYSVAADWAAARLAAPPPRGEARLAFGHPTPRGRERRAWSPASAHAHSRRTRRRRRSYRRVDR